MSETRIHLTRTKLVRIYATGLAAFAFIIGSLTLVAAFLARLDHS
jgi:hypothetical protein